MKLFIIRHGETNYNVLKLCSESPGTHVFLTKKGKEQAQQVAEELAHIHFDEVYVSELYRTLQTASIINQYHELPLKIDSRIDERISGFDNLPLELYRQYYDADWYTKKAPNAESFQELKSRVRSFLQDLFAKRDELNNVLIVSHGQTIHAMKTFLLGMSDEEVYAAEFAGHPRNGEIFQYEL
ncbi:histidine phosphatase family protein [Candidatus Woesearchaeota archaeon]|nr:histidine phosphatase family protein [Candidatus Woesearchaeota archaeon]